MPLLRGDDDAYAVEKQWVVVEVRADGQLVLETPRGKRPLVAASDAALRRPTWWERLTLRSRFPTPLPPADLP